jgi:hypothetical protein
MKRSKVNFGRYAGVLGKFTDEAWKGIENASGWTFSPEIRGHLEMIAEVYQVIAIQEKSAFSIGNFEKLAIRVQLYVEAILQAFPVKRGEVRVMELKEKLTESLALLVEVRDAAKNNTVLEGSSWDWWVAWMSQVLRGYDYVVSARRDCDKVVSLNDGNFARLIRAMEGQFPKLARSPKRVGALATKIYLARKGHPKSLSVQDSIDYWNAKLNIAKRFFACYPPEFFSRSSVQNCSNISS